MLESTLGLANQDQGLAAQVLGAQYLRVPCHSQRTMVWIRRALGVHNFAGDLGVKRGALLRCEEFMGLRCFSLRALQFGTAVKVWRGLSISLCDAI